MTPAERPDRMPDPKQMKFPKYKGISKPLYENRCRSPRINPRTSTQYLYPPPPREQRGPRLGKIIRGLSTPNVQRHVDLKNPKKSLTPASTVNSPYELLSTVSRNVLKKIPSDSSVPEICLPKNHETSYRTNHGKDTINNNKLKRYQQYQQQQQRRRQ